MTDDGSDCATVMKDHELFSSPKASRHSVSPGCVTVGEYDLLSVENRSIFHLCPVQHMCSGVYQPIYLLGGELRDAKVISGSGATCSAYLLLRGQGANWTDQFDRDQGPTIQNAWGCSFSQNTPGIISDGVTGVRQAGRANLISTSTICNAEAWDGCLGARVLSSVDDSTAIPPQRHDPIRIFHPAKPQQERRPFQIKVGPTVFETPGWLVRPVPGSQEQPANGVPHC